MMNNVLRAYIEAYAYLIGSNPLWLLNMPGVDNDLVRAARKRQLSGQGWKLADLLERADTDTDTYTDNALPMAA